MDRIAYHQQKIAELAPFADGFLSDYQKAESNWYKEEKKLHKGDGSGYNRELVQHLFQIRCEARERLERCESELAFHRIMAQEKKYATELLYTDAHAYEIIEEKSDRIILVRRLKATIKPKAKKALRKSFVPGGFCGHFDNDVQEWDFESDESNPIETIRRHKDGMWYAAEKRKFVIRSAPYEFYDYNF